MVAFSIGVKATVLLVFALVGTRLAPRTRASARHLWLAWTFGVLLVLPVATVLLPVIDVPVLPARDPVPYLVGVPDGREVSVPAAPGPAASPTPMTPQSPSTSMSIATWFGAVWLVGIALFLVPMAVALWRLRRIRRASRLWLSGQMTVRALASEAGIRRRVGVRVSEEIAAPTTCGVLRPVLLLSSDAHAWSDSDLRRALAHELEHVRRGDWFVHCVARVVCAMYWFHPLVWIAWRRLVLEAERACDDAVLCGADRTAYAEQLVTLARQLSPASARFMLSMAGHSDLSVRVSAVLDSGQARGRVGRVRAATTAVGAVAMLLVVSPLRAVSGAVQHFDAAAITRNTSRDLIFPSDPHARVSQTTGGTCGAWGRISLSDTCLWATNMTVRELITFGFSGSGLVPPMPPIVNGPAWIETDRFDVVARIVGDGSWNPLRPPQLPTMVGALLSDRFGLTLHHERRTLSIHELVMARPDRVTGPRLRGPDADCVSLFAAPPRACGLEAGAGYLKAGAINMSQLAAVLSNRLGHDVRDRTRLAGRFAVGLTWVSDRNMNGLSLFSALEQQLGLRLAPATGPVDVLVIDRVSAPRPD